MKSFALIGAAGYIAPRHMKAIKETEHDLVAAVDRTDNVGVLDSYFPKARFFTEFEQFDRYLDILRRDGRPVELLSVASPNYLHEAHIRFGLRAGADVICEKPLVLSTKEIGELREVEAATGRRVFTILQLRLHPSLIALRDRVQQAIVADPNRRFEVDLTYLTSRGPWYFVSWKGDERKSGGIAANIGIHFFDMLGWIFGSVQAIDVTLLHADVGAGVIEFANARVRWFLSINDSYLPEPVKAAGQRTYRSITVDGAEVEFSDGFTDLHTQSYRAVLDGTGFGLDAASESIELVERIGLADPIGVTGHSHPFARHVER